MQQCTCGRELVLDPNLSAELGYDEYVCPPCQKEFEEKQEAEFWDRYAAEEAKYEAARERELEELAAYWEAHYAEEEAAEGQRRISESAKKNDERINTSSRPHF